MTLRQLLLAVRPGASFGLAIFFLLVFASSGAGPSSVWEVRSALHLVTSEEDAITGDGPHGQSSSGS